jgi:hypothetical protein
MNVQFHARKKHSVPIEWEALWAPSWAPDWVWTLWLRLSQSGSGKGKVAECLKQSNETSGFIKCWELID